MAVFPPHKNKNPAGQDEKSRFILLDMTQISLFIPQYQSCEIYELHSNNGTI
jgi:hypothetical protein